MQNVPRFSGERVRKLRLAIGLSSTELAYTCGVSETVVSKYEVGKTTPSVATLAALATALQVKIDDLFEPAQDTAAAAR